MRRDQVNRGHQGGENLQGDAGAYISGLIEFVDTNFVARWPGRSAMVEAVERKEKRK